MERSILGRALAACAAAAMLSTGTANAAERIVFVGDSITGQSRNHGEGFANQLDAAYAATMAEGDRPTVISLGGSGQTVESWLNVEKQSRDNPSTTLDVAGVYVGQNLDQHADRLVVMLGMNNALSPSTSEDPASLAAYKGNYYGLVTNLVRRATPADLYLASVPPCTEDPSGPKNRLVQKMNEKIRELVAELPTDAACLALQPGLQVHYVPVWENQTNLLAVGRALTPAFHVTGDMVHPSGEGHIRIAQSFLDAFGHDAASAWLVANRLQAKFDAAANGNTAGISHVLRPTGAGSVAGQHAFSLKAYWVVRPGETAPDSVAFALKLPNGWNETAPAAVDGLQATFTFQGPTDRAPSSIGITATPSTGNQRSSSVSIPAPWRVSTPFQLAWSNASGNWVFPSATADGATEAAIEAGDDFATIETADTARTPSWVDYFPSVDYVGGDNSASLDLSAIAAYEIFGSAYALRYVYAEKATTAKISLSTGAFAATLHTTVWVNGEKVLDADSTGAKADVTLNAGNNVIAVRTSHLTWQWQVGVAVEADDNSFDLRYGLAPLEAEEEDDAGYEPEVTATLFDGSVVYTFLSNGFFRAACPGTADVFIVGGGGGGAGNPLETLTGGGMQVGTGYDVRAGGGGGGGGVVFKTGIAIAANTDYAITVGAGGAQNRNGKSSFAFGYEALGGGHGGRTGLDPASGASGGGSGSLGGNAEWTDVGASAADVAGGSQGNAGGRGYSVAYNAPGFGGGGGGAGGAGGDATTDAVGAGGAGVPCPFLENSSGYGAGGAGGNGGYGSQDPTMNCGANGADGFGQGGAGGGSYVHVSAGWGGAGGSGTVIIRFYPDELDPDDYPNTPSVHALKDGTLVYTYSTPGSALFTPPSDTTVKVFLVGGGGGGGGCNIAKELLPTDTGVYVADGYSTRGGGGGAGGAVVSNDAVAVEKRAYVITVGAGGAQNSNGGSSYAFGLQAAGGGAGAWNGAAATAGGNGGGGNYNHPAGASAEGFYAGGSGIDAGGNVGRGGGGAGAGGAGADATANVSGAGGPGVVCPYIADSPVYGAGGNGGQVFGTSSPYDNSAADAAPGTGNGGDGCNTWYHINAGAGGAGGCGCVIIVCPPTSGYFREEARHEASGGEKLLVKDDRKWMTHSFLEDGTFSIDEPLCVQALLVGGGGAGGKANNVRGGGGGAGGVLLLDKVFLLPGDYPVVVGAGGETAGADGEPSSFDDYVALGGGGGGNAWNSAGRTGGSGGGGCGPFQVTADTVAGGSAAATDPMQGHDGGYGIWNHSDTNGKAGGGGGAGSAGEDATLAKSGSGGSAIECAFLGAGHYYAAGGGAGGCWSTDCGAGGMGSETELGGHGGYYAGTDGDGMAILVSGTDGADGTGSGGGGEGSVANQNSGFGKGGSGIVIIRYRLAPNGTLLMLK